MKHIAFLIEGHTSCTDALQFPEIVTAKKLALENKCMIFDPIASMDTDHISTALKDADERKQKILVMSIFLNFVGKASPQAIIDQLIKASYQYLVSQGTMKSVPKWIENLSPANIDNFAKAILADYFDNDIALFQLERSTLQQELSVLSDKMSSQKFMAYLREHEEITVVYGLIGKNHLSMLNHIGKVIEQRDGYSHIIITFGERKVNIQLFGGFHGETAHYRQMVDEAAKRDGLVVPAPDSGPTSRINLDSATLAVLLSTILGHDARKEVLTDVHSFAEAGRKNILPVSELVSHFDWWVQNTKARELQHNEALEQFIYAEGIGANIRDYEHFCELAYTLATRGYKTNPPPTQDAFERAMKIFEELYNQSHRGRQHRESDGQYHMGDDVPNPPHNDVPYQRRDDHQDQRGDNHQVGGPHRSAFFGPIASTSRSEGERSQLLEQHKEPKKGKCCCCNVL